jgi:hypothetical protein
VVEDSRGQVKCPGINALGGLSYGSFGMNHVVHTFGLSSANNQNYVQGPGPVEDDGDPSGITYSTRALLALSPCGRLSVVKPIGLSGAKSIGLNVVKPIGLSEAKSVGGIKGEVSSNFVGGVYPEGIHPDFVPRAQSEGRAPSPARKSRLYSMQ